MAREHKEYVDWCKANGYDFEKATTWFAYIDATSLYSCVMSGYIPIGDYWKESMSMYELIEKLRTYTDDDPRANLFEVT